MGSKGSEVELPDSEDEEQAAHGAEEAGVTPTGCAMQQTRCLRPAKAWCTRKLRNQLARCRRGGSGLRGGSHSQRQGR
jgi:S-adenosylmethionine synthetase